MTRMKTKKPSIDPKKNYWGEEQESAVCEYQDAIGDSDRRDTIFTTKLYEPLVTMVECVKRTFTIDNFAVDEQSVMDDALSHVTLQLDKFDRKNGAKTFSYFTLVIKHFLMQMSMKQHKSWARNEHLDTVEVFDNDGGRVLQSTDHVQCELNELNGEIIERVTTYWEENIDNLFSSKSVVTQTRCKKITKEIISLLRDGFDFDWSKKTITKSSNHKGKKFVYEELRKRIPGETAPHIRLCLLTLVQSYNKYRNKVVDSVSFGVIEKYCRKCKRDRPINLFGAGTKICAECKIKNNGPETTQTK